MKSQIFKEVYPKDLFINFISKFAAFTYTSNNNSSSNSGFYLINKIYFKKAIFLNIIDDFLTSVKPYYHRSKQKYLNDIDNYSKFMTVIRQLCKINEINFASKIKYDKSSYDICYYIYI